MSSCSLIPEISFTPPLRLFPPTPSRLSPSQPSFLSPLLNSHPLFPLNPSFLSPTLHPSLRLILSFNILTVDLLHSFPISHLPSPNDRRSMVANNPGEGFNSSGTPLSGLKKDEYHGKLTGLAAAERRLAVQKKIGKGGVLGGSSVNGRSMKDVLAEVCLVLVSPSLILSFLFNTSMFPIPLAVPLPMSIIIHVPS
jgi:hypothetical protein